MANFKVGDTVEIVEENDYSSVNTKGDIGIVLEVNEYPNGISTLYRVEVEGRDSICNWEIGEDLELVKAMEEFKVGDKVEVTDGTSNTNEVGDIGIITEMDTDNTYRVTVKGNDNHGNWMYPNMFKLVESPVNATKYVEVDGKDLIVGHTYSISSNGSDKGIYEGLTENGRCLFTPVGSTTYSLYDSNDYGGMYTGKFSIYLNGFFYEEREAYWDLIDKKAEENNTIDLNAYTLGVIDGIEWQKVVATKDEMGESMDIKVLKPIERKDLVKGIKYYLDENLNVAEFMYRDDLTDTLYFNSKESHPYMENRNGYILFDTVGNPFYEVGKKKSKKKSSIKTTKVEGTVLEIGKKYYLDTRSDTLGTYVGLDTDTNKILFDVKDNKGGYRRNEDGYIDFVFTKGSYFYEVK